MSRRVSIPISLGSRPPGLHRALGSLVVAIFLGVAPLAAQEKEECLVCHGDVTMRGMRGGKAFSVYVDDKKFSASIHNDLGCVGCHMDLSGAEFPHEGPAAKVECGTCHDRQEQQHKQSLHGQALARGDRLAPDCAACHGTHDILPVKNLRSAVAPLKIPFVCGQCHREGAPVMRQRNIHQANILDNYSESIHGRGLLKGGLIVSANCASCHTSHMILPHTNPRSSIARKNIARTCTQCHAEIEMVHQKVIRGELWEREVNTLPACVDCHQPHKIRRVFYSQGFSDEQCLSCHEKPEIVSSRDGRSLSVSVSDLKRSRHNETTCSQCHSGVNVSHRRPCDSITEKVNCSNCHAELSQEFARSIHGRLLSQRDPNAPSCKECHGTHRTLGKADPPSPTFPTNIPGLCGRCHRQGNKAAVRYTGIEHEVVEHYTESIHGKGLLKSGLTVTAMCTNCHSAHYVLPAIDSASSVHHTKVASTCGHCHHGIQEKFERSIHYTKAGAASKDPPTCNDCHTAHTIRRADEEGFKLAIMTQCGRCHEAIAKTYFDTYHGKVSQLGYTKTAKCYDCHGAHDILPISDPRSHLSRENVVETCQKCHPGATRRFAGYLTHATHHDPGKYPFLFYTFWGMTGLLIVTFVFSGIHTLMWLPRAVQMRRARKIQTTEKKASEDGKGRSHRA